MKSEKLTGIEAGRGVAALLVLGIHVRDHLFKNYGGPVPLGDWFIFGHAGVDFFFVLSGFIIAHVHARDIGRAERLGRYLQRRVTRIYPFYWVICGLSLMLFAVAMHHRFPSRLNILTSCLLLPLGGVPFVDVAWTLRHEVIFYALFAILIVHRRVGLAALGAWFICSLPGVGAAFDDMNNAAFSVFNLEFLFGLGAAWWVAKRTSRAPFALFGCGAILFFAVGAAENARLLAGPTVIPHFGYAIGSMLAIVGLVEAERKGRLVLPRWMVSLGTASYAIYLAQGLGMAVTWQVLVHTRLDAVLPPWTQFVLLFVFSAMFGWAISLTIERPLLSWIRGRLARAPSAPAPATAKG